MTTRETRELQVHAHQDAAGGGQAHGGDGEEFREGHDGGFRHGQRGKEVVQSGTARKGEESQCRKKKKKKNRLSPRGTKKKLKTERQSEREIETESDIHMPMSNLKEDNEGT